MRETNSTFIAEKNKAENQPIFLYTIEDYDGASNDLNFAAYDIDVTYDGVTYTASPLQHDQLSENSQGEIDAVSLSISNVNLVIEGYLENYDLRGKKVLIKTVFANQLADTSAYIEDEYYIDSYYTNEVTATFKLSSRFDILDVTIPARIFSRNYCSWKFKSTECGYSGGESSCNKTFQRCRELANQERFGGFPSIPLRRLAL